MWLKYYLKVLMPLLFLQNITSNRNMILSMSMLVHVQYVLYYSTTHKHIQISNTADSFHVVIFQVVYELLPAWKLTSKWYFFQSKNVKMFDIETFSSTATSWENQLPSPTFDIVNNQLLKSMFSYWKKHLYARIWK